MSQRPRRARVEDNPSLERDIQTNAILNRDRDAYQRVRRRKILQKSKDQRIEMLESQVQELLAAVKLLTSSQ